MDEIIFRPHHFLCNYCFEGKGYSDEFVDNFTNLNQQLNLYDSNILVSNSLDAICSKCPSNQGTTCKTESKVVELDQKHSEALGLVNGQSIKWSEAKSLIEKKITPEIFNNICTKCEWFKLGICYNNLFVAKNIEKE